MVCTHYRRAQARRGGTEATFNPSSSYEDRHTAGIAGKTWERFLLFLSLQVSRLIVASRSLVRWLAIDSTFTCQLAPIIPTLHAFLTLQ